jgi:hypothetical protein
MRKDLRWFENVIEIIRILQVLPSANMEKSFIVVALHEVLNL